VIEQAKGALAQYGQVDMAEAFTVLRRCARDHNRRLAELAQAVVDRALTAQDVFQHVAGRKPPRASTLSAPRRPEREAMRGRLAQGPRKSGRSTLATPTARELSGDHRPRW
jgi:hypothetical protein